MASKNQPQILSPRALAELKAELVSDPTARLEAKAKVAPFKRPSGNPKHWGR